MTKMTDEEINNAINNRQPGCCGDPATCQGVIKGACKLIEIYEEDMKARSNED